MGSHDRPLMGTRLDDFEELVAGKEHHLYIAEIVGLGVKVGITGNPRQRLRFHRSMAEAHGRKVGRVWVSMPHVEARDNEKFLKNLGDGRREYMDLMFEATLIYARRLPMNRALREDQWESFAEPIATMEVYTIEEAARDLRILGYDTGKRRLVKLMREVGWIRRDGWGAIHPEKLAERMGWVTNVEAPDRTLGGVELTATGFNQLISLFVNETAAA